MYVKTGAQDTFYVIVCIATFKFWTLSVWVSQLFFVKKQKNKKKLLSVCSRARLGGKGFRKWGVITEHQVRFESRAEGRTLGREDKGETGLWVNWGLALPLFRGEGQRAFPSGAPVHLGTQDKCITNTGGHQHHKGSLSKCRVPGLTHGKSESVGSRMWPKTEFFTRVCWENYNL